MMQFWTYFWRFRQCQLNFMPFASTLHAAVALRNPESVRAWAVPFFGFQLTKLLRACRERPGRCVAEQRDELAASHANMGTSSPVVWHRRHRA